MEKLKKRKEIIVRGGGLLRPRGLDKYRDGSFKEERPSECFQKLGSISLELNECVRILVSKSVSIFGWYFPFTSL
jgi:hypothetical protein